MNKKCNYNCDYINGLILHSFTLHMCQNSSMGVKRERPMHQYVGFISMADVRRCIIPEYVNFPLHICHSDGVPQKTCTLNTGIYVLPDYVSRRQINLHKNYPLEQD